MPTDDMYPGQRVGAILSAQGNTVRFLGFGVYEGDFMPDGMHVPSFEELQSLLNGTVPFDETQMRRFYAEHFGNNGLMRRVRLQPRIRLDNGDIVWGGECYWDDDAAIRKVLAGKDVVAVRLNRDDSGSIGQVVEVAD